MKKLSVICYLLLVISSNKASALSSLFPSPALNGPTGLVRVPNANVIPYKNFNLGADYGANVVSGSVSSEAAIYYKMNLGTFHGVEIGIVGSSDKSTNKLREGVFVNMKLSLTTGDEPYPLLLALGVENLFSYTQTDVYMVATKYFKQGPKLSFGFLADFHNNKFRPMGIAGVETSLSENLIVLGDIFAGETLFQANAGARLYLTPIFSVNLSGVNLLDSPQAKDSRSVLAGFSWANPF